MDISNKGLLYIENNILELYTQSQSTLINSNNFLCMINKDKNLYSISPETKPNVKDNKKWISIRGTFDEGYELKLNDIIKIGKIVLRIKYLFPNNEKKQSKARLIENSYNLSKIDANNTNTIRPLIRSNMISNKIKQLINESEVMTLKDNKGLISNTINKNKNKLKMKERNCRICLGNEEESSNDNPLISGCKCSGTMKYIHLECLKSWLMSKIAKREVSFLLTIYSFESLKCELCNHEYSRTIIIDNKVVDLITIYYPNERCLVLEQLSDKGKSHIVVLDMSQQESVTFGRSTDCDIRFLDVSVSRIQTEIAFKNNKFVLIDKSSKFGTLLYLDHCIPICYNGTLTIIINSIKLDFTFMKSCFYYLLCCREDKFIFSYSYYKYREIPTNTSLNFDLLNPPQIVDVFKKDSSSSIDDSIIQSNNNSSNNNRIVCINDDSNIIKGNLLDKVISINIKDNKDKVIEIRNSSLSNRTSSIN